MPSRTRAQKEARLERAKFEAEVFHGRFRVTAEVAMNQWRAFAETSHLVAELEKQLG